MVCTYRKFLFAAAVSLALGVPGGEGEAQSRRERRSIDTTFTFSRTGTVMVGNGSATVIVTGWDQPTIRVRASSQDGLLRFDPSGSRLVLETARNHDDAMIQIMVPRGVRVVAQTNAGDITIRSTRGDVEARTSSGDILVEDARDVEATNLSGDLDVRQISGAATISTNNGDCSVSDSKGNIEASSVSGDVRVARVASRLVRARTTNGDVYFDGTIETDGRYEFVSHSGNIDLALPKDASAQMGVTTWSGSVDSEFPITLRPGFTTAGNDMTKRYTFTIGAGSARITAETFNGDIIISARGGK